MIGRLRPRADALLQPSNETVSQNRFMHVQELQRLGRLASTDGKTGGGARRWPRSPARSR